MIVRARQEGQSQQLPRQRPPPAQLQRLQLRAAREETSQLNISWCHQSVHTELSSGPQHSLGCTAGTGSYQCPQMRASTSPLQSWRGTRTRADLEEQRGRDTQGNPCRWEAGAERGGLEQILVQDLGDTRFRIQLCQ